MRSRPLMKGAIALIVSICSAKTGLMILFVITGVFVVLCMIDLFYPRPTIRQWIYAGLILAMIPLGIWRYSEVGQSANWYENELEDNAYVQITGQVQSKQIGNNELIVYLAPSKLSCFGHLYRTNKIMLSYALTDTIPKDLAIGNTIQAAGTVSFFSEARNPGNFDLRAYYNTKQVDFKLEATQIHAKKVSVSLIDRYKELLFKLKLRIRNVFIHALIESDYGLLCTMVLGDKSLLDDETKTLYQSGGISHILAISGLHISIIGMLLYRFLRKRGASYLLCASLSAFLVLSFGLLVGVGTATFRALTMFLMMLFADTLGEAYDSISGLSAAAILLLLYDPLLLFGASFQLSFAAVTGAVLVNRSLGRLFPKRGPLQSSFLLCLSIQAVTIPITLWYYFEIPTFSILINVCLLPLVSVILIDGILGGIVGLIFLPAATILLLPCKWIFFIYRIVLETASRIPHASIVTGQPHVWKIIIYYTLLLLLLKIAEMISIRAERVHKAPPLKEPSKFYLCMINFSKSVLLIGLLYAGVLFLSVTSPKDLTITMIDVGQGDGILVQNPDGSTCFFDGGSTDIKNLGKYRVEPTLKYYGVDKIDEWFVSHTDADHISALEELLENGYPIKHLYFAKGMVNDDTTETLINLAQSKGTKVCLLAPGERVQKEGASYTCIFPEVKNNFTDKNDACLVIELKFDRFCALFTGDLTEPGETYLTQRGTLSHVNLLKVCHHGSKTSSSEEFLAAIDPDCAWISAGVDNSYGHPAAQTIENLKKHTDRIYVTKESGAIRGVLKNNRFLITTFIQ